MAVAVVAKTVSVGAVSKTVVSKTVSVSMAVVSVVGISLGLSISSRLGLSGPLAVVSKTVSVVAKTGVSVVSKTVSVSVVAKTVSVGPVSKPVVSKAVVSVVGIG